ncbi:MAG: hypothetical protein E7559_07305 [Ruminococcaceae bacterium]|nr:hypothetical protein [Oscillospiraceae bacterium]
MSKFSERLAQIVHEKKLVQKHLSARIMIDNADFSRMLKGLRRPTEEQFERLCSVMSLPAAVRQELEDYLEEDRIGQAAYEQHDMVRRMIGSIESLEPDTLRDSGCSRKMIISENPSEQKIIICSSAYAVDNAVKDIVEMAAYSGKNEQLRIFCSFKYKNLFSLIYQILCSMPGCMSVKHLLSMESLSESSGKNNTMRMMEILPFALSVGSGYSAYYYFTQNIEANDAARMYPYYIVSGDRVLRISSDFETGVLLCDADHADLYRDNFDMVLGLSEPVVTQYGSMEDTLSGEQEHITYDNCDIHYIVSEPALCRVLNPDVILSCRKKDISEPESIDKIANLARVRFSQLYAMDMLSTGLIFSVAGLDKFMETGRSSELPECITDPFPISVRLQYLEKYIELINKGGFIRAANPAKLRVSRGCSMLIAANKSIIVNTHDKDMTDFRSAHIFEESVLNAFKAFLEYIHNPRSKMVLSREETLGILTAWVERLRERQRAGEK